MYAGKDLTQFIALLAIVNGAAPILAPIFGGVILKWMTWKAVFYILSMIGLVMFLTVLFLLPETLPKEKRIEGNIFAMYKSFGTLFKDCVFLGILWPILYFDGDVCLYCSISFYFAKYLSY